MQILHSLWMLAAAFFYACMSALVKECSASVGTFELVFFRASLTLIFVFLMMRIKGISPATHYPWRHFCRSICGAMAFTLWFAAMGHLPLGTSVTLSYTGPLFIALTTVAICFWYRRRVPWILILAIVLGFIGICIMMRPTLNPKQMTWALCALASGAFSPVIFMTIQKLGQLKEPSLRIVFYFMLVSTIWGGLGMCVFEGGIHAHSTLLWSLVICIGVCSTLGQISMTYAYAKGHLLICACLHFSTIPIAEIFSVLVFHEPLSVDALIGMGMILGAGILSTLSEKTVK